ncbi:hypothetical protein SEA_DEXDERT_81 [Gordonia phage Dexdert]|uniref:Uncharacterized protein n=1 Tax=Gordonia phage Dexdert TaxID=2794946 RepID=A0A7T1KS73_9CAUD|nr:hypothetical protein J1597_gp81 [Gordonia phage Dexdert]QPO17077.1 hypothetical protein SEA_DEXDERT_81 [Gordonia phage Dexdert]
MSGGTVTRYRCRKCGEVWTWRNTQEGRNDYARQQYRHDGMLEEVPPDEYPGRHRNGEPGLTWWPVMLYRWNMAAYLCRSMGLPEGAIVYASQMRTGQFDEHPREYHYPPYLGIKPGAPWVDGDGKPIILHTSEGRSE